MQRFSRLTLEEGKEREWWLSNSLGGFAGGTLAGCNTRRYHGLLIASDRQGRRQLLWSKAEVILVIGDESFHLGTNQYTDGAYHPEGYLNLLSVEVETTAVVKRYLAGGCLIEETVTMISGSNATVISYYLLDAPGPVQLVIDPFVNHRGYHEITQDQLPLVVSARESGCEVTLPGDSMSLILTMPGADFIPAEDWYYRFFYQWEELRGLESWENHFRPGRFSVSLVPGERVQLSGIAAEEGEVGLSPGELDFTRVQRQYRQKRDSYHRHLETVWQQKGILQAKLAEIDRTLWSKLLILADSLQSFLIRVDQRPDVIAGYPWFTGWGRDTMISLPGLAVATGEMETARSIIFSYAQYIKEGLIPNRFLDQGGEAYNTVDASLWFVMAVYHFLDQTQDHLFGEQIWPAVHQIIHKYLMGTEYNIGAYSNGLLHAGAPGVQLTWMDAKVGEWVVTPRIGYPVEINALWYNTLQVGSALATQVGRSDLAFRWAETAELLQQTFAREFWNSEKGCLFDLITTDGDKVAAIRPNQILAVSLPFPLISKEKAAMVVSQVSRTLYTPGGLRSLAPGEPEYHPKFLGDPVERDSAYHQGTAWLWLIGPFIRAYLKVNGATPQAAARAKVLLDPILEGLWTAGIGHISEISEPEYPFEPRGCPAQAWSEAELLRAYVDDVLPILCRS